MSGLLVEEAVHVLGCSLAHYWIQFMDASVAQLLDTGKVLKQGHGSDLPYSRYLLHQRHDQGVQQVRHTPPPEWVLLTFPNCLQKTDTTTDKFSKYMDYPPLNFFPVKG